MFSVFRVVFILSLIGTAVASVLILMKPVTSKAFSAKWQYYIWIVVLLVMVFPLPVKFHKESEQITPPAFLMQIEDLSDTEMIEIQESDHHHFDWQSIVAYVWFAGVCIYIISALVSYWRFLAKKKFGSRKASVDILKPAWRVGIKKLPSVRISADQASPMLVGIIKPVIYLPDRKLDDCVDMVVMHELMHCKRHDLLYKWVALIINGIHWFNPTMYLVKSNINEACEISCDIEITKNMNEEEKKKYMQIILNLIHS